MDLDTLARTPSPESWRLLCQALDKLPAPTALAAIASLEGKLAAWPDELRATMCGMTWDDEFFDGNPNPRSTIVRYLRFDRYFSGRYNDGLRTRSRAMTPATMRAMCASEGVRFLKRINFSYQLDAEGVAELAACKHFAALAYLEIDGCSIGERASSLTALAKAEFYGRLTTLDVVNNEINGTDVGALFVANGPQEIDLGSNSLGVAGATTIAKRLRETPRRLRLATCELGDAGARALASCTVELERLALDDNHIGDEGLRALVSGTLRALSLSLRASRITHAGVRALVDARWPLVELDLSDNGLEDAAARILAADGPEGLTVLSVDDNDLTADGLSALVSSERLAHLKTLTAGTNRIGAFPRPWASAIDQLEVLGLPHNRLGDGIRSLAAIESESLVELDLTNNVIGIREFEELTGASWFSRLKRLKLANNPLGIGAGVVFGAWTALEVIDLSRTGIGDEGACAMFDAGLRPTELSLDGCDLSDVALEHLVRSPTIESIEILHLRNNAITERGVRALLAAAPKRLTQIHVAHNRIDDAGIAPLAAWSQLLHVGADGNPYGKVGEAALAARPVRCCP